MDPDLKSPSNDEIVAGAEYEVLPNARARRDLHPPEPGPDGGGHVQQRRPDLLHRQPGRAASPTPSPPRSGTYDAVTVLFSKNFSDLWLAQVSYTWSQLRGNYDGLFNAQGLNALGAPQLDPNINSTFDLRTLLLNQKGPLSGDITHTIKAVPGQGVRASPRCSAPRSEARSTQTPVRRSTPWERTRSTAPGQAFILERGSAGRLPWVTSFDARVELQLPAEQGQRDHRLGGGVQPLQLAAADLRGRELHRGHRQRDPRCATQGSRPDRVRRTVPRRQCAASCSPGERITPHCPRSIPSSPTGRRSASVLPNRNGVPTPTVPNLAWGTPTNLPAGPAVPVQPPVHVLAMDATMRTSPSMLLLLRPRHRVRLAGPPGVPDPAPPPRADGYVLRFIRAAATAAGVRPQPRGDQRRLGVRHPGQQRGPRTLASACPTRPLLDPLPPNFIGRGTFTSREADANGSATWRA